MATAIQPELRVPQADVPTTIWQPPLALSPPPVEAPEPDALGGVPGAVAASMSLAVGSVDPELCPLLASPTVPPPARVVAQ